VNLFGYTQRCVKSSTTPTQYKDIKLAGNIYLRHGKGVGGEGKEGRGKGKIFHLFTLPYL
jgi:hypothetical protein